MLCLSRWATRELADGAVRAWATTGVASAGPAWHLPGSSVRESETATEEGRGHGHEDSQDSGPFGMQRCGRTGRAGGAGICGSEHVTALAVAALSGPSRGVFTAFALTAGSLHRDPPHASCLRLSTARCVSRPATKNRTSVLRLRSAPPHPGQAPSDCRHNPSFDHQAPQLLRHNPQAHARFSQRLSGPAKRARERRVDLLLTSRSAALQLAFCPVELCATVDCPFGIATVHWILLCTPHASLTCCRLPLRRNTPRA